MRYACNLASKHSESTSVKGKKQHDKKASYSTLEAGDQVSVRNRNGTRQSRKTAVSLGRHSARCCES